MEQNMHPLTAAKGGGPLTDDAEAELQDALAGLRASADDFAAGRWTTPEGLDVALRARRP